MDDSGKRAGFLILRAFFAQFWVLQFLFKIRDEESGIVALRNLGIWAQHVTASFAKTPLPGWSVLPYTHALPWAELLVGLCLALGLKLRASLVAAALVVLSLEFGLMLQGKHEDVARNLIFLLALLLALQWEPFGRGWSVDAALDQGGPSTQPPTVSRRPMPHSQ